MTTITKDFVAKLAVAFVAVAMVLVAFAPSAQAQTTEELQAMINDLLAQVAALQGGGAPVSVAGVCPYTWTRDLSMGSTGADVMRLQQFLNSDPDTRVAATGVGSAGMESDYYGALTAAAVSKMQVKYRAEVLTPAGLVNPTGYFGPSSRAKANSVCIAAPVVDGGDDMDDDDMMDDDDDDNGGSMSLSGEASLDNFEVDDAEETDLEEGAEDAPVAEITVEFTDGDAEISRLDLDFVADAGNDEDEPWDVIETISLWVDGDKIAEEDADDEDDWLDEDNGEFRFSNLDIFGEEDEEVEIIVAVTLQNSLDGVNDGEEWDVSVVSMRFFDADGVATTDDGSPVTDDTATFTIEEEGFEDELIVKTNSSDPDSATLQVEDDSDSDWYTVFIFDLDTDDSENDIELNELSLIVDVASGSASVADATYAGLVDDVELVIDGTTIDDLVVSGGTATGTPSGDWDASRVLRFDVDGDVVIDAGDRVQAELRLRFNSLAVANEGSTVRGRITGVNADAIDAEGGDDLDESQLSGSATGDIHTLRTEGIDVSPDGTSAETTSVDQGDDYGTFEIQVEVTAFEQEVFINTDPSVSFQWDLRNNSGTIGEPAASTTVVLDSTADEDNSGNYYEINEGQTETFTLTVTYTPGADTAPIAARLRLDSITFDDDASSEDQVQTTLPATDYRTSVITIQD